jgi:hypothetical protein
MSRTPTATALSQDTLASRIAGAKGFYGTLNLEGINIPTYFPEHGNLTPLHEINLDRNTAEQLRKKGYPLSGASLSGELTTAELDDFYGENLATLSNKEGMVITGEMTPDEFISRIQQGFFSYKRVRLQRGKLNTTPLQDAMICLKAVDFSLVELDENDVIYLYSMITSSSTTHDISLNIDQMRPFIQAYQQKKKFLKKTRLIEDPSTHTFYPFESNVALLGLNQFCVKDSELTHKAFSVLREKGVRRFDNISIASKKRVMINKQTELDHNSLVDSFNDFRMTFEVDESRTVTRTAAEFCDLLERQYQKDREGIFKKLRSDKVKKILETLPGDENKGRRFFQYLEHIHAQEKGWGHKLREFFGITSRRMHSVFYKKVLTSVITQTEIAESASSEPRQSSISLGTLRMRSGTPEPSIISAATETTSSSRTFRTATTTPAAEPSTHSLAEARAALSPFLDSNGEPAFTQIMQSRERFEIALKQFQETKGSDQILSDWIQRAALRLDHALSSFFSDDILNNNLHTQSDRLLHENRIAAAYIFLKIAGGVQAVEKYNKQLCETIYPHYLRYTVYNERYQDETGAFKKLRFNLLEKMFIEAGIMPDSVALLSQKRNEKSGGITALFGYKFRQDSPFRNHCDAEWAKTPLSALAAAGCVNAEIATQVFEKSKTSDKTGDEKIQHEKQCYIALLILREEYKTAEIESRAFSKAWPNENPFLIAKKEMRFMIIDRIATVKRLDQNYKQFERFIEFLDKSGFQPRTERQLKKRIDDSLIFTSIISKMTQYILANPPRPVPHILLQQFIEWHKAIQDDRYLVWAGNIASHTKLCAELQKAAASMTSRPQRAVCDAVHELLLSTKPITQLKRSVEPASQINANHITPVVAAVYQSEQAITLLNDALSALFHYHGVLRASPNGDLDETLMQKFCEKAKDLHLPESSDFATLIRDNPALSTFLSDCGIDCPQENFSCYLQLITVKNAVKRAIKSIRASHDLSDVKKLFENTSLILHQIKSALSPSQRNAGGWLLSGLFRQNTFSDCIDSAIEKVTAASAAWAAGLSNTYIETFILLTEEETEENEAIKDDLKTAVNAVFQPIFAQALKMVREAESRENTRYETLLTLTEDDQNEMVLTKHSLSQPGSQCPSFLEHVLGDNAFKYVCAYELQCAKEIFEQSTTVGESREQFLHPLNVLRSTVEKIKRALFEKGHASTYFKTNVFYETVCTAITKIHEIENALCADQAIPYAHGDDMQELQMTAAPVVTM